MTKQEWTLDSTSQMFEASMKILKILFIFSACLNQAFAAVPKCKEGWKYIEGYGCYLFDGLIEGSWYEAYFDCDTKGGFMVSESINRGIRTEKNS